MTSVIKIGKLTLNMGNVSHTLEVTKNNLDEHLKYLAYQAAFNKGGK